MLDKEVASLVSGILTGKLGISANRIDDQARFDADLHASSLDVVEVIMALEDEFGIEISDSDAETLKTVGDLAVLVQAKLERSPIRAGTHAQWQG
jgi:acyl carrier protein